MTPDRFDAIRERHTQAHDPSNGPPYCRQCSHTAQAWVKWPCDAAAALDALAQVEAERDARTNALAELVDAISDDLSYEVSKSPEVQRKVRAAVVAIYGEHGDYSDAWWLARASTDGGDT